jgi:hypothetical protein
MHDPHDGFAGATPARWRQVWDEARRSRFKRAPDDRTGSATLTSPPSPAGSLLSPTAHLDERTTHATGVAQRLHGFWAACVHAECVTHLDQVKCHGPAHDAQSHERYIQSNPREQSARSVPRAQRRPSSQETRSTQSNHGGQGRTSLNFLAGCSCRSPLSPCLRSSNISFPCDQRAERKLPLTPHGGGEQVVGLALVADDLEA